MSDNKILDSITGAVSDYLTSQGATGDTSGWVKTVVTFVVDACDGKARRDAEAKGQAKADQIKTEVQAEKVFGQPVGTVIPLLLLGALFYMPGHAYAQAPAHAPDVPGVSIHLEKGEIALFPGRLNSDDEEIRRAQMLTKAQGTLDAEASDDYVVAKPAFWAMVGVTVAAIASSVTLGIIVKNQQDTINKK